MLHTDDRNNTTIDDYNKGKEKVEGNSIKKELEGGPENEAAGEHQAYCGFSTENVVNT